MWFKIIAALKVSYDERLMFVHVNRTQNIKLL